MGKPRDIEDSRACRVDEFQEYDPKIQYSGRSDIVVLDGLSKWPDVVKEPLECHNPDQH